MATFNDMLVTNAGKVIYSKALNGKGVNFIKVEFGSGMPESQAAAEALTKLVDSKIIGAIESVDTTSETGVLSITVQVDNSNLTEAIGIREIGVFCTDPDTGSEVMYAYMFSPTDIDVIPSKDNGAILWKMYLRLTITNATATQTEQSNLVEITPTITATAKDGITTFVSEVIARCFYEVKGNIVTAFYRITGKLSNMLTAETNLERLIISLPKTSAVKQSITAPMTVVISDDHSLIYPAGSTILVDVLGKIEAGSSVIDIEYFGLQSGSFELNFEITYGEV